MNSLTIDKYDNLVIDASSSYDPENLNLNYYYTWTCPGKVSCSSKNSSVLTLTSTERQSGSSNVNGTTYTYSVVMKDGSRTSPSVSATIHITMKDSYAYCLTIAPEAESLNSYWSTMNQTLYVEYQQTQSISLKMKSTTHCDSVVQGTTTFTSSTG